MTIDTFTYQIGTYLCILQIIVMGIGFIMQTQAGFDKFINTRKIRKSITIQK